MKTGVQIDGLGGVKKGDSRSGKQANFPYDFGITTGKMCKMGGYGSGRHVNNGKASEFCRFSLVRWREVLLVLWTTGKERVAVASWVSG